MLPGLFTHQVAKAQQSALPGDVHIKREPTGDDDRFPTEIARPAEAIFDVQELMDNVPLYGPDDIGGKAPAYDLFIPTAPVPPSHLAYRTRPLLSEPGLPRVTARICNPDGSKAPTACFEGSAYSKSMEHTLICGHSITTIEPEPCRSNCKPSQYAESKQKSKRPFTCMNAKCVSIRRAEKIVFMPKKKAGITKNVKAQKKFADDMTRARVERGLAKMAIDETSGLRTVETAIEPDFAKHDTVVGAANERQKPNLYAAGGRKSKRNRTAEFFSVPEDAYADMIAEEEGVIIDLTDTISDRYPRAIVDHDLDEDADGEETAPTHGQEERYCICESVSRGFMLKCVGCRSYFHPGCVGKGLYAKERYEELDAARAHRADISHFRSEGFDFTCQTCDDLGLAPTGQRQQVMATQLRPQQRRQRQNNLANQFSQIIAEKQGLCSNAEDRKERLVDQLVSCMECRKLIVGVRYHCLRCLDEMVNLCTTCQLLYGHNHELDAVQPPLSAADVDFLISESVGMRASITSQEKVPRPAISETPTTHGVDRAGDIEMHNDGLPNDLSTPADTMDVDTTDAAAVPAWRPTRARRYDTRQHGKV